MSDVAVTLVSAAQLSTDKLVTLINQAYSDYFLFISLDQEKFVRMCFEEDINLAISVVALVENRPLGIALLAQRGLRGWISAVGVVPLWRRQGIARKMLKYLQIQAREKNLTSLTLEVLIQNHRATTLYESLGFVWQRDLFILSGEPLAEASNYAPSPSLSEDIRYSNCLELLQFYHKFHEIRTPWQRDLPTLRRRAPSFKGLSIWEQGQLIGYLLYKPQAKHHVIYDLAVCPAHPDRIHIAKALLHASHSYHPEMGGYVINFPAEDPLLPAFTRSYYHVWQQQYEMIWRNNDGTR
jgi:ribosomal protein S18 acetylase RimI-like enzyme